MITYSNKTYKVFFNGVLLATRTGTTEQVNYLRLRLANAPWSADAAGAANITTKKSQLYPRALSEAECIALTTL
jgi:biotin transporter BioY